ncbi:MAG: AbrB/MazE/SpoVT family DNA-binding domain-containing protein [Spirochaetales bacterium]|nr:AbrB/MazE/SpoVT family DNA-binding domain-containing protein [Spirochaetales bacterium]
MKIKLESQGRISLPIHILQKLGLKEGDSFFIDHSEEGIVLVPKRSLPLDNTDSVLVYQNHFGDARVLTMK